MRFKTSYIFLGCAVALLVVGAGGLVALVLIASPQLRAPLSSAIGGPFTLAGAA